MLGLAAAAGALDASAQAVDAGGRAVDPNVSDRGPNAASLRVLDRGNAQHSFATRLTNADFRSLWTPLGAATGRIATDPSTGLKHSQRFRYAAPGVRALVDQPNYLVDVGGPQPGLNVQPNTDGAQVMITPANTVFQLTLERKPVLEQAPPPAAPNYLDLSVDLTHQEPEAPANPVSFAPGDGQPPRVIDAAQLRFPAAALAARDRAAAQANLPGAPEKPDAADTPATPDAAR